MVARDLRQSWALQSHSPLHSPTDATQPWSSAGRVSVIEVAGGIEDERDVVPFCRYKYPFSHMAAVEKCWRNLVESRRESERTGSCCILATLMGKPTVLCSGSGFHQVGRRRTELGLFAREIAKRRCWTSKYDSLRSWKANKRQNNPLGKRA